MPDEQTHEADEHVEPETERDDVEAEDTEETNADDEPVLPQSKVDEIVRKRLERERRKWEREQSTRKPKSKRDSKKAEPEPQPDPGAWRDAYYDAVEDAEVSLSRKQRQRMRKEFRRDWEDGEIDDPHAWVEEYVETWGISNEPEPSTKTKGEDVRPPVSDKGSPSTAKDYDTMIDPNKLTGDDIRRMEAKYGKAAARRKIREMAENWYRDRKIVKPD